MKRLLICSILALVPMVSFSQMLTDIDYVSPFHENLAAIKKDNTWGFIDRNGDLVIDFRNDLVIAAMDGMDYPFFNSGRCLIKEIRDGIAYFGYIDTTGKPVLKPQFLNATPFNDGIAVIIKLYKNVLGQNDVLDKAMIKYSYNELAIKPNGETAHYLSEKPTHITLSRDFMNGPPEIKSKFLTKSLIAVKDNNNKWSLKKV